MYIVLKYQTHTKQITYGSLLDVIRHTSDMPIPSVYGGVFSLCSSLSILVEAGREERGVE